MDRESEGIPGEREIPADTEGGVAVFRHGVGVAVAAAAGLCVSVSGAMTPPVQTAGASEVAGVTGVLRVDPSDFVPVRGARELTGMLLVRPRAAAESDAIAAAIAGLGGEQIDAIPAIDQRVVRIPAGVSELDFARELASTGLFVGIEPNWLLYPAWSPPNDPMAGQQWHLPRIRAFDAWDLVVPGPGWITVAFVDTGVDTDHPDLAGVMVPGYNSNFRATQQQGAPVTDVNGHGTVVAGVAAAITNNDLGVAGVSLNVGIMPVRASNLGNGAAFSSDISDGIIWAIQNGAKIVNVGFDGVEAGSSETLGQYARNNGVLLVWPIGNGSKNKNFNHPSVTVVSGTNNQDRLAPDSSFGPGVDLAAPSVGIRSTRNDGQFGSQSGTSFAAPIVSGTAALVWLADPTLSPAEVEAILIDSADDIGESGRDDFFGAGVVDALAALRTIVGDTTDPFAEPDGFGSVAGDNGDGHCQTMRLGEPPVGFDRSRPLLQGLSARYFNLASPAAGGLPDFDSSIPVIATLERNIAMTPAPGKPFGQSGLVRDIAAEFIGELIVPEPGLYRITLDASGTARVTVDGVCVAYTSSLDDKLAGGNTGWLYLGEHPHDLRIEYTSGADQPYLVAGIQGGSLSGSLRGSWIGVRHRVADADANGYITDNDLFVFIDAFIRGDATADANGDGIVDGSDLQVFLDHYVSELGT